MITTLKPYQFVKLEIQADAKALLLNKDSLNVKWLDDGSGKWADFTDRATSINVKRGKSRTDSSTAVDVGTLTATFYNDLDPYENSLLKPGTPIRLSNRVTGQRLFTGVLTNLAMTFDKESNDYFVAITAADRVQVMANIMRYGISSLTGPWEAWSARVKRLLDGAGIPYTEPEINTPYNVIYSASAAEALQWEGSVFTLGTRGGENVIKAAPAPSGEISRQFTGITIGDLYQVSVRLYAAPGEVVYLKVAGEISASSFAVGTGALANYSFPVSGSYRTLGISLKTEGTPLPEVASIRVQRVSGTLFQAMNNVYESNILNHLTLACNTGGRGWFVNPLNIISFEDPRKTQEAYFSDISEPSYTVANVSYDTSQVINELEFKHHALQGAVGNRTAKDTTFSIKNNFSEAFGQNKVSLDFCVYDPSLYTPFTETPDNRYERAINVLARVFMERATVAEIEVAQITINAMEQTALACTLDIYAKIGIGFKGREYANSIVGIEHMITPKKWLTTYELMER